MCNKEKLSYLGITKFHQHGYSGKGITIASREDIKSAHGAMVAEVIKMIAPEARLVLHQEYTKKFKGDIYTTSLFFNSDKYEDSANKSKELYMQGCFLCCAVGNYGNEKQTQLSKYPWWCSIGACDLSKGIPKRLHYSSITDTIDFMSFTNMETSKGIFTGTSCATPVFASMICLVQEFFKDKCGRKLTNSEILNFVNDNLIDMEENGFDNKTGDGLFVLPDPEEIDVKKYINANKIIKLKIGSGSAEINNDIIQLDAEPIIYRNRTMVPIRFIAEALGAEVNWDEEKKQVTIIF